MRLINALGHALEMSFSMAWLIFWPLVLGFLISAVIQSCVSHKKIVQLLPDDKPKSLCIASLFGAASSSCSYAAVAIARTLFKKGANFSSSMAFQIASTNLVLELGIVMWLILGWQFAAAEFIGGPIMVISIAVLFRGLLKKKDIQIARKIANGDVAGKMEGHAAMDMSLASDESIIKKIFSKKGFTSISHYFVMDWSMIGVDIIGGLLIAGAIEAWVPTSFFEKLFVTSNSGISNLVGPLIGPLIAIVTFVCSVGNVPLAAVLYRSGMSFGGVISFIFADLLVFPILRIYKKYYGKKVMFAIVIVFYIAMVIAGYVTQLIFSALSLVPRSHHIMMNEGITFNYTSILNIFFMGLTFILIWKFLTTGGPAMMKMMSSNASHGHDHNEGEHHCH